MQKLYCYVDETGQDTRGKIFIVSVIIQEKDLDLLRKQLEEIERDSGKGRRKWMQTRPQSKVAYLRRVLKIPSLKGRLCYATYNNTTNYLSLTVLTTARAITTEAERDYQAVVYVDGLPRSLTGWFGSELRHLQIRTRKIRGVRNEEADALMRLADAACGFIRDALSGWEEMKQLLNTVKKKEVIRML